MASSLSLRALALSLFAVPLLASAQSKSGVEVVVRGQGSVEQLAAMLHGKGRVVARENVPGAYRIRLSPGLGVDYARKTFTPGRAFRFDRFAGYTQMKGQLDTESVSSIQTVLSRYDWIKQDDADAPKLSGSAKLRNKKPDALGAKLYRLRQFAFPYDKIDPSAQIRAAAQLEKLRLQGRRVLNGPPPPTQKWTFTGPKNLDIPYVVYYGTPPLSGRVNAVAYDPSNPTTLYVGSALGGVMKSTDNGVNWTPLSDNASWPFLAVNSIVINPNNSQEIFVGVGDYPGGLNYGSGIMHSKNGGATWRWLSSANGLPALNGITKIAIAAPGNGQTGDVIVATAGGGANGGGGVFRSTDDGDTWTQVLSSNDANGAPFSSVAVSAAGNDNRRWFYAVAPGFNAYKRVWVSKDRGATWAPVTQDPFMTTRLNPVTGKEEPYGLTYLPQMDVAAAHDAAPTGGPEVVTKDQRRSRFYVLAPRPMPDYDPNATDFDETFPPYDSFKFDDKGNPIDYQWNGRLMQTTNGGTTWTDLTDDAVWDDEPYNWSQYWYNYHLTVGAVRNVGGFNETDDLFYGQIDVVGRRNGGAFESFGGPSYAGNSFLHNDQHAMAVNPKNPDEFLIGNDGGVFRAFYDRGQLVMSSLNRNLGITQFYHGAWHPTDPDRMIGGAQDNASPAAVGESGSWKNVGAGDGGFSAINPTDPRSQYTSYQFLGAYNNGVGVTFSLIATTDGWLTSGSTPECTTTANDNLQFISPIHISRANAGWMYVGTRYLSRYNMADRTWTPALGGRPWSDNSGEVAHRIETAASAPATVLVSTTNGGLFRTLDHGATWRRINGNLPVSIISGMSIDPTNAKKCVVTLSRQDATPHVWATDDITVNNPVWRDVSYKVDGQEIEMSALSIERDFDSPVDTWYVGTQFGVYYTQDAGATYTDLSLANGLPRTEVSTIHANPNLRTIEVATFGRGMYRLQKAPLTASGVLTANNFDVRKTRPGHFLKGTVTLKAPAGAGGVLVNVNSYYKEALIPVAAEGSTAQVNTVLVPQGQQSADYWVYSPANFTGTTSVRVEASVGTSVRNNYIAVSPPRLDGSVAFGDVVAGGETPTRMQYWLRNADGSLYKRGYVNISATRAFRIIGIPEGSYSITLRAGTFLGRKLAFNSTTADPILKFSFLNGDVNGDNKVDDADAAAVTKALGTRAGMANWNMNADLNKDGIVDATDAAIVSTNKGKVGDD